MSENKYNFENFEDDTQVYGKRYKDETPKHYLKEDDNFDFEQETAPVVNPAKEDLDNTQDYGDDFGSQYEDDDFVPYVENAYNKYDDDEEDNKKKNRNTDNEIKKKNIIIVVLTIVLAIIIFGIGLFFLINAVGNTDDADTKETKPTTVTVSKTEPSTQSSTDAPTEALTDEPTDAPTEEPTEEPTQTPTQAPTDTPVDNPEETFEPSIEDPSVENISWE